MYFMTYLKSTLGAKILYIYFLLFYVIFITFKYFHYRYERFVIALEEALKDMLPNLKDKAMKVSS